jgi:hypothetical protein
MHPWIRFEHVSFYVCSVLNSETVCQTFRPSDRSMVYPQSVARNIMVTTLLSQFALTLKCINFQKREKGVKWDVSGERFDLNYPHSLCYLLHPSTIYIHTTALWRCVLANQLSACYKFVLNFLYDWHHRRQWWGLSVCYKALAVIIFNFANISAKKIIIFTCTLNTEVLQSTGDHQPCYIMS